MTRPTLNSRASRGLLYTSRCWKLERLVYSLAICIHSMLSCLISIAFTNHTSETKGLGKSWLGSNTLPRDGQVGLMLALLDVDRNLLPAFRCAVGVKGGASIEAELAILVAKYGRLSNARSADQSILLHSTLALPRCQSKAIISLRSCGKSGTASACVPGTLANDTTSAVAISLYIEKAFTGEGCARSAGWSRTGSSSGRLGAASLGRVLDACLRAGILASERVCWDEITSSDGTLDIKVVPDFIEDATMATKSDGHAVLGGENRLNLVLCVCLAGARDDASILQPVVGIE